MDLVGLFFFYNRAQAWTELLAVCSGKLLVFIQYNIPVWSRSYGSRMNALRCLVADKKSKAQKKRKNGWTKITLTSPLKNGCGKGLLAWHYRHRRETITKYENKLDSKSNLATALCVCLWCSAVHILYCVVRIGSDKLLNISYKFSATSVQTASCRW